METERPVLSLLWRFQTVVDRKMSRLNFKKNSFQDLVKILIIIIKIKILLLLTLLIIIYNRNKILLYFFK